MTEDKSDNDDLLANETRDLINQMKGVWCRFEPGQITNAHIEHLVKQMEHNRKFSMLTIQINNLNAASIYHLSELLKENTKIRWLYLSDNGINDAGAQVICRTLRSDNRAVTLLDLRNNRITDRSANAIIEMIRSNRTLAALVLRDNELSREAQQDIIYTAESRIPFLRVYL